MAQPGDQQSLLRWGIENATPGSLIPLAEEIKAGKRPDLNTDVLKAIMGKTDADRMLECMSAIEAAEATRDQKLLAWDDLEMLIEDLDNANDLKFMKLWPPIVKHLSDADEEVILRACWVCGTAVQNNPKAQTAFLELDPLPTVLPLINSTTHSSQARSKALYCVSATLKHCQEAVDRFSELDGWKALNLALQDPSASLRAKAAFLISQLILQSPTPILSTLRSSSILPTLISSLTPSLFLPTGRDGNESSATVDYQEKGLKVLVNLLVEKDEGSSLTSEEVNRVKVVVEEFEGGSGWKPEEVGLAVEEWKSFKVVLEHY